MNKLILENKLKDMSINIGFNDYAVPIDKALDFLDKIYDDFHVEKEELEISIRKEIWKDLKYHFEVE